MRDENARAENALKTILKQQFPTGWVGGGGTVKHGTETSTIRFKHG